RGGGGVFFFVVGRGLFVGRVGEWFYSLFEKTTALLLLPPPPRHWFDMGEHPHFVAVRLFNNPEGWVAQFTGDDIASRFPLLED
ncbi:acireductone dioxygenase, partial [Pseudomonas aeruginosa]